MRLFIITITIIISTGYLQAEGINFMKGKWETALAEAKSQGKLIFLDAYASWCGPCKKMTKHVFSREDVGDFYNNAFVNVKMDMEKGQGPKLAKKYKVRAYPTLFFINGDGKVILSIRGGRSPEQFIDIGKSALKKFDNSAIYAKQYEAGKREPALLKKYAYALVQARKPHLKIANEYFKTQKDLTTPENLKAIFDFALEADSKLFKLLVKHKKAIAKIKSKAAVEKRVEQACYNTVNKAIEFKTPSLLKVAKKAMKKNSPKQAKQFKLKADMQYALGTENSNAYLKASKKYIKKYVKNNAVELQKIVQVIAQNYKGNPKAMKAAEGIALKAAQNSGQSNYYVTYAKILIINGKKGKALAAAEKAKTLAQNEKQSRQNMMAIDQLIRYIQEN